MIEQIISDVRTAEAEANEIIKNANQYVKDSATNASIKAENIVEQAKEQAKKDFKMKSEQAVAFAETQTEEILNAGSKEAEVLKKNAKEHLKKAVSFIVKKVISI